MLDVMDWINEHIVNYLFGTVTNFKINFLNENEVFLNEKIDKDIDYTLNERMVLINEWNGKTLKCALNNMENVKMFYCFQENENELKIIQEFIPLNKLELPIENFNISNIGNEDKSEKFLKSNMTGSLLCFYSRKTVKFINLLIDNFSIFSYYFNEIKDFSWNPKIPFMFSISSSEKIQICEISNSNEVKPIREISDLSSIIACQYSVNGR